MRYLWLALFLVLSFNDPAHAACTNPAGAESATRYDFAAHKLYYCNGTGWLEIGGSEGGEGGDAGTWCGRRYIRCATNSQVSYPAHPDGMEVFACKGSDITGSCSGQNVTVNCPSGYVTFMLEVTPSINMRNYFVSCRKL